MDVTHATDYPGVDVKRTGEAKLGAGPTIARGPNINPPLRELLETTADKKKLPWQLEPDTPVEIVSLADLENAAKIIAETCLRITPEMDFIPL